MYPKPDTPRIRSTSLTPVQHRAKRAFRIATDYRVVPLIKHPYPSEFHSLAEYLHAGLLEGDSRVSRFVPQPFQLRIGKTPYVPDVYVVRGGEIEVLELKPRGEFDPDRRQALEAFFRIHRMRFVVKSNESILERELEARNWLRIAQTLLRHASFETGDLEWELQQRFLNEREQLFGDFLLPADRDSSLRTEVALLRMLHQGLLTADLTEDRLNYDTVLRLWT